MRTRTQVRPLGADDQTDHLHQQSERAQNELQIFDSTTVKVENTTRGIRLHAKIPPSPSSPTLQIMFPFKAYQICNDTATADQIAPYTANNVNISDFTYQVRSGIIGTRFTIPNTTTGDVEFQLGGNYELPVFCPCTDGYGSFESQTSFFDQPAPNSGYGISLDNSAATLIGDTATLNFFNSQIFINSTPDSIGERHAAFWIELIENSVAVGTGLPFFVKLWGRMFTQDPPSGGVGRTLQAFPTGENIYPLAMVGRLSDESNYVYQLATGNFVNRFVEHQSNYAGLWSAIPVSGKQFYNGDFIVDDTRPVVSGGITYFKLFQFVGGTNSYTIDENPALSADWLYSSAQIQ